MTGMGLLSPKLTTKQMYSISTRLATAITAGIPILKAFELLCQPPSSLATRRTLRPIHDALLRGATLEEALIPSQKYLPREFVSGMVAGDRAGQLHRVMQMLAAHYEYRLLTIRRIIGQSTYVVCILIFFFFILPFVRGIAVNHFKDDGDIGDFVIRYGLARVMDLIQLGITIFVVRMLLLLKPVRIAGAYFLDGLRPLGSLLRKFAMARYLYSLGLMLEAGLTNKSAHLSAIPTAANYPLERKLGVMTTPLESGTTYADAMRHARTLRPELINVIEVGEQSGSLEHSLYDTSRILLDEARHPVTVIISLLEVFLIVIIAIGMFQPFLLVSLFRSILTFFG